MNVRDLAFPWNVRATNATNDNTLKAISELPYNAEPL